MPFPHDRVEIVANTEDHRFHRYLDRLESQLPDRFSGWIRYLRAPDARLLRIPAGVLLICGGFLGFLPILGFWMIPLGVLLLAIDVPFLRGPTAQVLHWIERHYRAWRIRRGGSA